MYITCALSTGNQFANFQNFTNNNKHSVDWVPVSSGISTLAVTGSQLGFVLVCQSAQDPNLYMQELLKHFRTLSILLKVLCVHT